MYKNTLKENSGCCISVQNKKHVLYIMITGFVKMMIHRKGSSAIVEKYYR